MSIKPAKIVEEWVFRPDCLNGHKVKGRITFTEGEYNPYYWEISHHYAPAEEAGIYHPSRTVGQTLEEVRLLLFSYVNGFTDMTEANEDY